MCKNVVQNVFKNMFKGITCFLYSTQIDAGDVKGLQKLNLKKAKDHCFKKYCLNL